MSPAAGNGGDAVAGNGGNEGRGDAALAMHRLFGLYMLISAAALAFPHRGAGWAPLLLAHLAAAAAAFGLPPMPAIHRAFASRAPRAAARRFR